MANQEEEMSEQRSEECHCLYYEPGLVSYECDNCRRKRVERQRNKKGNAVGIADRDSDIQAE